MASRVVRWIRELFLDTVHLLCSACMDEQSERVKGLKKHRLLKHIRIKSDIM